MNTANNNPPSITSLTLILFGLCLSLFGGTSLAGMVKALPKLEAKSIAPVNFFYGEYQLSGSDMHLQGEKLAEKTAYDVATKTHGLIDGPFTYRFEQVESLQPESLTAQIGWPVNKAISATAGYLFKQTASFKAVTRRYEGMHTGMVNAWKKLLTEAIAQATRRSRELAG